MNARLGRILNHSFLRCYNDFQGHICNSRVLSQDGQVMVERSDRMWSTGEGNGKPLQYSCLENPMNSMKRQNDRIPKEELPRSVSAQYATGDQWRNNSRRNEGMDLRVELDFLLLQLLKDLESSSFGILSFCLFILFMGFSRHKY